MEHTASKLSLAQAADRLYPRKWPAVRRMTEIVRRQAPLAKGRHQWIEDRLLALYEPAFVGPQVPRRRAAAELRYMIKKRYKWRRFKFLARLSADLRQPGVIVTGRNRQGARETLDPTDIEGATLDIEKNTIDKNRCCWDSASVELPQTLTETGGVRQATPGDAMAAASRSIQAREGQDPRYSKSVSYSSKKVPVQFTRWAEDQHRKGVIITVPKAEDAMRGAKDAKGNRSGGILKNGPGLSRDTIRAWTRTLDPSWRAGQGTPPARPGRK